jgi:hypothetical protein
LEDFVSSRIGSYLRQHHLALLALVVALSGTAYAATKVGPDDIARNAVRSKHIKKGQVKKKDLHCPKGLRLRAALCFEKTARSPADWQAALAACEARDLRLPTIAEDYIALSTFPTPASQQDYWASDVYTVDSGDNTRIAIVAKLPGGSLAVGSALQFTAERFICVTGAGS